MAELTLDMIPSYRVPLGAERVLGEMDELGNPVYRMPSGKKFTLYQMTGEEAEEQAEMDRWPLGKVAGDLREAVWDYVQNPELPTWSQIKNIPAALLQGTAEEVQGAMDIPTPANILGLAVGAGAASSVAEVPEGALRIFGGRKAQVSRPSIMEEDLKDRGFERSDFTADELYDQYGVFTGMDGLDRFEINTSRATASHRFQETFEEEVLPMFMRMPDHAQKLFDRGRIDAAKGFVEGMTHNGQAGVYFDMTLSEVLNFPDLFDNYPQLAGMPVNFHVRGLNTGARGAYWSLEDGIDIELDAFVDVYNPKSKWDEATQKEMFGTLLHEVQHAVQEVEGFDPGSSPSGVAHQAGQGRVALEQDIQELAEAVEFLEPLEEQGLDILGRAIQWQPYRPNWQERGLSDKELMRLGIVNVGKDAHGDLMYEKQVTVVAARNPQTGRVSTHEYKSDHSNYHLFENIPDGLRVADQNPLFNAVPAYTVDINGEEWSFDIASIEPAKKKNTKLINKGLDKDYYNRIAQGNRSAYDAYRATSGEIEANTVAARYKAARTVAEHLPSSRPVNLRQTPLESMEILEAETGEAIRRPRIKDE